MPGKRRCKYHGGTNPGGSKKGHDTTKAREGRKRWLALLHMMGLKNPGGHHHRDRAKVLSMAEDAKATLLPIIEEAKGLPDHWGSRLMERAAEQLYAIIDQDLDPTNLKQQRLVGDMSLGSLRLLQKAATDERKDDAIGRLLAMLEAEKEPKQR